MKVSFNWLKEFVEIALAPREVAERLTMAGVEVEGVEGADLSQPIAMLHEGIEVAGQCAGVT